MVNQKLNEQLVESVIKNKLKKVKYILRLGGDVKYRYEGWPVLFYAKSDEMFDLLTEFGAKVEKSDINKKDSMGHMILEKVESPKLADKLIEMGENVNAITGSGWNVALYARNNEVAEVILNNGGRIFDDSIRSSKSCDEAGETALMQVNCLKIFNLVCEKGANPNATDIYGNSVLHYFVKKHNVEIVRELVGKVKNIDVRGQYDETPLMWAVSLEDKEMVYLLLGAGADKNAKCKNGDAVIHKAHDYEILKILVDEGCDIEARDKLSNTPLHKVIDRGDIKSFKYLIEKGSDIHASNESKFNCLIKAVFAENEEMIRILIDKGVDIKARNIYGYDAMRIAGKELREVILDAYKRREIKQGKNLSFKKNYKYYERN